MEDARCPDCPDCLKGYVLLKRYTSPSNQAPNRVRPEIHLPQDEKSALRFRNDHRTEYRRRQVLLVPEIAVRIFAVPVVQRRALRQLAADMQHRYMRVRRIDPHLEDQGHRRAVRAVNRESGKPAFRLELAVHLRELHPHDAVAERRRDWPGTAPGLAERQISQPP